MVHKIIIDGIEYPFIFNILTTIDFEELTGKPISDIFSEGGTPMQKDIFMIIHLAMAQGHTKVGKDFDLTWRDVALLCAKDPEAISKIMVKYAEDNSPAPGTLAAKKKKPTTAQRIAR